MPLLELIQVSKHFAATRALDGVSFDLGAGEVHALCGENGAGKSTLIKVLCGYYPAGSYGGELRLDGQRLRLRGIRDAEHHGIALIAQELALVPELSVAENLMLGREPAQAGLIRWQALEASAREALERVDLDLDPRRRVGELGIGQQQMVEIAKALAKQAQILVLDEPTAALTETDARRLLALLADLRSRGVSCVYVSHRLEEVFAIADRITVLRDGKSVGCGAAAQLTADQVIRWMVGREVKDLYPKSAEPGGPPLLAVDGWSVGDAAHPGRRVLEDVSFELRRGEVLGIGGLMGAGRTALLSSLFGIARGVVEGRVHLEGRVGEAPLRSPAEAIAAGLALVSEDRVRYGLLPDASVRENLTLATLRRFARRGLLDHAARDEAARAQVDSLRIKTPDLAAFARQLSGGNQQKLVLGRWLMARPRVLFLDEPTRGIDVGAKAEIYQLIARLAGEGLGVVLVSSDLPELLGLSHRVLVLSQGRETAVLEGARATPEAVMAAATAKA